MAPRPGDRCAGHARSATILALAVALAFSTLALQAQPATGEAPLTATLERDALNDLPSTSNLFSLLETTQADVVSDRFFGGVNAADAARLGVFMTSWTQTTFRMGDVDVTSADRGGPLFVPSGLMWQRVGVTSGMMPVTTSGPGLLVDLEPRRPPSAWAVSAEASGSRGPLVAMNERLAPAIVRSAGWTHAAATLGGPLASGRAGALLLVSSTRASQFERGRPAASEQSADSLFSHVVFSPRAGGEVSTVAWRQITRGAAFQGAQVADGPSRRDVSTHVQSTWSRRLPTGLQWRIFGGVTQRAWDAAAAAPAPLVVERLVDGPVSERIAPPAGRERRLSAGWRTSGIALRALGLRHDVQAGVDVSHVSFKADAAPAMTVGERVGGIAARIWAYTASGSIARDGTNLAAFVADNVRLSDAVTVEAGLRVDRATGDARGARQGVVWNTVLPRVGVRWQLSRRVPAVVYSAYTYSADALRLGVLANGDPAAPVADVRLWDDLNVGTLVARVGPGAGADARLTAIDPSLARPMTRELAFGLDTTLPHLPRLRLTGVYMRRARSLALVNEGVPASSYTVSHLADPGANLLAPEDDQLLPIYDRALAFFGQDRYLLTNAGEPPSTLRGLTLLVDRTTPRLFLGAGAAMGWSHGEAGSRGFGAAENDLGVVGDLLADPNAATHARGNLFFDRQYTVRIATAYRFAHDITIGGVARYQDGQPFSRMVVVPDLHQGADAVRAFRSGKSRFTFTGTLDVRLQKGIALPGGRRAVVFMDGFNVLNLGKEVEEWVVTGPEFRTPTAVQPPRIVHLGLRLSL